MPRRHPFHPHPTHWLSSPQSGPSDELEAQSSKTDKASILLSSLPLNEELTKLVDLEEVIFSLVLGTPAWPVITKRGLGPTLASYLSTEGQSCVWGGLTLLTVSLFQGQQVTLRMKADMK